MKLFSLDSPLGKAIAQLADLCILNLFFFVTCIPVVTIGGACAALYNTVNAMLLGECDTSIARQYFSAFGRCFKKGTLTFLIAAAFGAFMVFDLLCAMSMDSFIAMLCLGVIIASSFFYFAVMALLPMVVNRSQGKTLALIREAFLLAIRGSWRTIVAVCLNLLPWALLLFAPSVLLNTWMYWFLVGFAISAYVNCRLLMKVVDPENWEIIKPAKIEKKKK